MKKHLYLLIILSSFCYYQKNNADHVINLFIKDFPKRAHTAKKLKKAGKIAKHTIEGILDHQPLAGIIATYAGYIEVSDVDGEMTFPRKHESNIINLIITDDITPIIMFE